MVFNLIAGQRYTITSTVIQYRGDQLSAPERLTYSVVATSKFKVLFGSMRRLFIEARPEFDNGVDTIWLSNDDENVDVEALFGVQSANEDCYSRPPGRVLEYAVCPTPLDGS